MPRNLSRYEVERHGPDRAVSFFGVSNRVEHPILNQITGELPSACVFGVQLGLRETQALIKA